MYQRDLNKLTIEELGNLFPVRLSEFNDGWVDMFVHEKESITALFHEGEIVSIEHIGSTAIPGIKAKPTIDILIEVRESSDRNIIIGKLEEIGYAFIRSPENPPPHMMFAKGYSVHGLTGQTYHIHIRYPGCRDEILFRDYLNGNSEARADYESLKTDLAARHPNNRELYTSGKTEFVKRIISLARKKQRQLKHHQAKQQEQ